MASIDSPYAERQERERQEHGHRCETPLPCTRRGPGSAGCWAGECRPWGRRPRRRYRGSAFGPLTTVGDGAAEVDPLELAEVSRQRRHIQPNGENLLLKLDGRAVLLRHLDGLLSV